MMEKVLLTGANGLIGRRLSELLTKAGYEVVQLVRQKDGNHFTQFCWNPDQNFIEEGALDGIDHIIHLAGENISAGRWTPKRKQLLYDSRVKTTQLLFEATASKKIKSFISASGVSFYGIETTNHVYTETDAAGAGFLPELTVEWEREADRFSARGTRVSKIRTGVVLSARGGALEKMMPVFNYGLGAAIGSGNQYFPWIHLEDICSVYLWVLSDANREGVFNAVAPGDVTNLDFTRSLNAALGKRNWLPKVPGILLKIRYGEMANLLLGGSRVHPVRLLQGGFKFKFESLDDALKNCCTNERKN